MTTLKHLKTIRQRLEFRDHVLFVFLFSSISLLVTVYILYITKLNRDSNFNTAGLIDKLNLSTGVSRKNENPNLIQPSCNFFTCFDVYHCGTKGSRLLVYVYPEKHYGNSEKQVNNYLTKEFHSILQAIIKSKYYTSNPNEACVFVPSIDLLHPNKKRTHISHSLSKLQYSVKGKNHLIFNLMYDNGKNYNDIIENSMGQSMIAGIGFTKPNYRKKFDISIPAFSNLLEHFKLNITTPRKWLLTSSQININPEVMKDLIEMKNLYPNEFQILQSCSRFNKTNHSFRCTNRSSYKYPEILQSSTFCLILKGEILGLSALLEALATRCVPVVVFDSIVMPFEEVLDWSRAAIFIREVDILFTVNHLKKYSNQRIKELRNHGTWLYKKYFKSIKSITETALDILADRVFPYSAKDYHSWNEPEHLDIGSPVFLPLTIPKNDGFTAVILTYDRIDLLFLLINKLANVPSLSKILVIWNNQYKRPPRLSQWPKIYKQIKVIQTEKNVLSNRFYPFDEIETEAVLSIDDDIIMLTEDEIEFAYEVWREFPDRIVGFPSRTHAWDNKTMCWKYESEWMNHISMVLTGAAFYHKYWNYAYTVKLPKIIKDWVDDHMNCEDIAMNFLVSNVTKKAPIKVTAKKKFRCPECVNTEMLSADLKHMVERTQCINQFTEIFGHMPLMSVEFRADPVLFKDNFPEKLKRFNDVGSL